MGWTLLLKSSCRYNAILLKIIRAPNNIESTSVSTKSLPKLLFPKPNLGSLERNGKTSRLHVFNFSTFSFTIL